MPAIPQCLLYQCVGDSLKEIIVLRRAAPSRGNFDMISGEC